MACSSGRVKPNHRSTSVPSPSPLRLAECRRFLGGNHGDGGGLSRDLRADIGELGRLPDGLVLLPVLDLPRGGCAVADPRRRAR